MTERQILGLRISEEEKAIVRQCFKQSTTFNRTCVFTNCADADAVKALLQVKKAERAKKAAKKAPYKELVKYLQTYKAFIDADVLSEVKKVVELKKNSKATKKIDEGLSKLIGSGMTKEQIIAYIQSK